MLCVRMPESMKLEPLFLLGIPAHPLQGTPAGRAMLVPKRDGELSLAEFVDLLRVLVAEESYRLPPMDGIRPCMCQQLFERNGYRRHRWRAETGDQFGLEWRREIFVPDCDLLVELNDEEDGQLRSYGVYSGGRSCEHKVRETTSGPVAGPGMMGLGFTMHAPGRWRTVGLDGKPTSPMRQRQEDPLWKSFAPGQCCTWINGSHTALCPENHIQALNRLSQHDLLEQGEVDEGRRSALAEADVPAIRPTESPTRETGGPCAFCGEHVSPFAGSVITDTGVGEAEALVGILHDCPPHLPCRQKFEALDFGRRFELLKARGFVVCAKS